MPVADVFLDKEYAGVQQLFIARLNHGGDAVVCGPAVPEAGQLPQLVFYPIGHEKPILLTRGKGIQLAHQLLRTVFRQEDLSHVQRIARQADDQLPVQNVDRDFMEHGFQYVGPLQEAVFPLVCDEGAFGNHAPVGPQDRGRIEHLFFQVFHPFGNGKHISRLT